MIGFSRDMPLSKSGRSCSHLAVILASLVEFARLSKAAECTVDTSVACRRSCISCVGRVDQTQAVRVLLRHGSRSRQNFCSVDVVKHTIDMTLASKTRLAETPTDNGQSAKRARTENGGKSIDLSLPSGSRRAEYHADYKEASPYKYAAIGGLISDDLVSPKYSNDLMPARISG